MDLDVSMRLSNYPYTIQFYGALFKEVFLIHKLINLLIIWVKAFKNGPSKIFGRQSLRKLKRCGLSKQITSLQIF